MEKFNEENLRKFLEENKEKDSSFLAKEIYKWSQKRTSPYDDFTEKDWQSLGDNY